jgi:hypothetical protein
VFLVVAVLLWSILLGLRAKRFGAREEALLVAGIVAAVAIQYVAFGPS